MIRFDCDYLEGAHPKIMERLLETNFAQTPGYGEDEFCAAAREKILAACGQPDADVHLLVGGTQVNLTVIAAALRAHQGVIAADSGHINVHESGAIEATGHKVIALPGVEGKLQADAVRAFLAAYWADATHEHMVQPAMVYISHPTEWGTLYTRPELEALHEVCRAYGLLLYMDGARLGYALAAEEHRPENDRLSLVDIARLTDAFYIGGTKVGTLFGEALVLSAPELRRDFRYYMKQRGGLLAKGRLLGIQFDVLFSDGLYMEISRHAVDQAMRVREAFRKKGFAFYLDSPTNQQFPILSEEQMAALAAKYSFAVFARLDHGLSAVRFCTSWATRPENVDQLIADIENL